MSEQLTQRIAEVLHDHYPLYCNERENCDTGNYVGGWAKHAAEAVAAALQLSEERYRSAMCPDDRDYDRVRWHSPWVEVQP